MRRGASVGSVSVARVARLDDSHALVTVAAAATGGTRYLTVPVARDARGGLVVSDLPSFAAPPARGVGARGGGRGGAGERARGRSRTSSRGSCAPTSAGDAGRAVVSACPRGCGSARWAAEHELVDVTSLALAAPPQGRVREVLATVRARDAATGATYGLRYRLRLVREDRWLVAAVNDDPQGGLK